MTNLFCSLRTMPQNQTLQPDFRTEVLLTAKTGTNEQLLRSVFNSVLQDQGSLEHDQHLFGRFVSAWQSDNLLSVITQKRTGDLVSLAILRINSGNCFVDYTFTTPTKRNRGFGKNALLGGLEHVRRRKSRYWVNMAFAQNIPKNAVAFYEKCGFSFPQSQNQREKDRATV